MIEVVKERKNPSRRSGVPPLSGRWRRSVQACAAGFERTYVEAVAGNWCSCEVPDAGFYGLTVQAVAVRRKLVRLRTPCSRLERAR